MKLSANQKNKLRITRQITLAGILLGVGFIFFGYGTKHLYPYVGGIAVGTLIGLTISILELYILPVGARKIKFYWLLIIKTFFYLIAVTAIIFNVVIISRLTRLGMTYAEVLNDPDFHYYLTEGSFKLEVIYTLGFALIINFTRMMGRKMGKGVLANYVKGTYYNPVHETRIIMFINVVGSKQLLGKLGALKFHRFLNNLYFDITQPAISNEGVIHEYIEDLMVISWTMNKGVKDVNCIQTFFDIQKTLQDKKEKYLEKFNFFPVVQAGLHTGALVTSEIGEVKSQIVFHGDTMNTTSRILGKCSELNLSLLASDQILRMLGMPKSIFSKSVGKIKLKGKQDAMTLYEIKERK